MARQGDSNMHDACGMVNAVICIKDGRYPTA